MIFTLGYQLRDLDEYVSVLEDVEADLVLDVRENAWSYKPGFRKSALSSGLADVGIGYRHASFAGNPKRFREQAETYEECLRKYRGYIYAKPKVLDQLDEHLAGLLSSGKRVCLLCYERHPGDCHRSILLEAWQKRYHSDVEIRHLGTDGAPRLSIAS